SGLVEFNNSQIVEIRDTSFVLSDEQPEAGLVFDPTGGAIGLISNHIEVISGIEIVDYYYQLLKPEKTY
ncbi:MAG: hypothetical protein IIC40_01410, partial [Candidatus Marinimicrobia bacterium]|nr:hypothetical protein [Candidatus Neomarinimicrobiota bacterium]